MTSLDIVCLGEPLMELNEQPDGLFRPGPGGDVSNVAVAAARQGAKVGFVSKIGADLAGYRLMELWAQEGINVTGVAQDPQAHTGIYLVAHGPSGHEFHYFRKGSAASRMRPDELPSDVIRSTRFLHVSGISQAISESAADSVFEAITIAKQAGAKISYDPNLRAALWPLPRARAIIHAAMARCDVALPGLEDAELLTGASDPGAMIDHYLALGAQIVALTLGAQGCIVATAEQREIVPARKVCAVDATGAGDTFDGAFLAELAAGRSPFDAAAYANTAAALSTQGFGAVAPIPRRSDVERSVV